MYLQRRSLYCDGIIEEGPLVASPRYSCVVPIVFRAVM